MPRPTKLTQEMHDAILKCIIAGLSYRYTCDYVGISENTFMEWRRTGEADEEKGENTIYSRLFREVKKAESSAILMRLKNINDASKESWQAAAWFLERKYPDDFGKKEKHDLGGEIKLESFLDRLPRNVAEAVIKLCLHNSNNGSNTESSS